MYVRMIGCTRNTTCGRGSARSDSELTGSNLGSTQFCCTCERGNSEVQCTCVYMSISLSVPLYLCGCLSKNLGYYLLFQV